MTKILPIFKPLSSADVNQIDQAGRRILAHIGIRIKDGNFLKRLEQAGEQVDFKKYRVFFSADRLDMHLSHAPSHFTLYSRDGKNDVSVGTNRVHFANGGRVFRILDTATGDYRLTMLRDVADTALLVNYLEHVDFYVIACQAHDLDTKSYHLNDFFHAFNHTTKHVMGGCDDLNGVEQVWQLANYMAGGKETLREKPFFSVIINPISPLTIEINTLNILDFCAVHGIPFTFSAAPIAGVTSPATLAGTLAQMHAEVLAGVAISQILAPGARVLYGAVPTAMDLRNMNFTMGSVEAAMMGASAVQLAKLYNLPIRATAGVTEAKKPDIQAGFEKSLSNFMLAEAGADCILLAAGILDSGNTICYEQFVIDNEILGMIDRALSGISVNRGTIGFDTIQQVDTGGQYVTEEHTIKYMMREFFYPKLSIRSNFDIWDEKRRPDMVSNARDFVHNMLIKHKDEKDSLLDPNILKKVKRKFPNIVGI